MKINELFLYLPIAAAIKSPKDNILCMHGGIGRLSSAKEAVERIEALTRPICVRMEV
jgi:protein phosphatase